VFSPVNAVDHGSQSVLACARADPSADLRRTPMSQIKGRIGQVARTTQEFAGRTVDIVRDQTGEDPLAVLGIVAVSSFLLGLLIGSAGASKQLFR